MEKFLFIVLGILTLPVLVFANLNNWQGDWDGRCEYQNFNSDIQQQPHRMQLKVKATTTGDFDWIIKYSESDERKYKMIVNGPGRFILDEGNGILIDRVLINNEIREFYVVNGRAFITTTSLRENKIQIKSQSYWVANPRKTSLFNGTFPVHSFNLRTVSQCDLLRKK